MLIVETRFPCKLFYAWIYVLWDYVSFRYRQSPGADVRRFSLWSSSQFHILEEVGYMGVDA